MDTQKRRTAPTQAAQGFRKSLKRFTEVGVMWLAPIIGIPVLIAYMVLPSRPVEPPAVTGDFRTRNYMVSDHEHIVVFDLPNRVFPTRCWTYVNERTATSNMQCDPNDDSGGLPTQGAELSR